VFAILCLVAALVLSLKLYGQNKLNRKSVNNRTITNHLTQPQWSTLHYHHACRFCQFLPSTEHISLNGKPWHWNHYSESASFWSEIHNTGRTGFRVWPRHSAMQLPSPPKGFLSIKPTALPAFIIMKEADSLKVPNILFRIKISTAINLDCFLHNQTPSISELTFVVERCNLYNLNFGWHHAIKPGENIFQEGTKFSRTTFTNSAPDQTVTLSGTGGNKCSGRNPTSQFLLLIYTTYSAGTGLSLSGTTFH